MEFKSNAPSGVSGQVKQSYYQLEVKDKLSQRCNSVCFKGDFNCWPFVGCMCVHSSSIGGGMVIANA